MKARPILFSGPMVRALLDDRKAQTRRILKPQPADDMAGVFKRFPDQNGSPYGRPGDVLWVRESISHGGYEGAPLVFTADGKHGEFVWPSHWKRHCRPSIHMPRWANRLTLELAGVRVERLQDISDADAEAEGMVQCDSGYWWYDATEQNSLHRTAASAYQELWRKLNGHASWEENPWVWVLEFKAHRCNVDAFLKASAA